ncbi:DEAD/DEAH box helicase domain-containing protein [Verrucomicrobium sp. GAS474]|uniref:ribonuclease H-like domain-containing protein n=1 Tax=Verrucomicrobium sp. GAS474 TaxID=1882831 RepID=UPI00087C8778|nr:ribonuclease H-like domain-containing protein [Verrucomicrobium sp. GAS474]SDU15403.1 DEAD/DEAH box helicase domain-containing protein [Verrucomicrobium sp. GAS474]
MKNIVYFDLETQRSAAEVGGWQNKREMKMSVGVTYSTAAEAYRIYPEEEAEELIKELRRADCVVGFNILNFDFQVLEAYTLFDLGTVAALDLMVDVEKSLGRRLGLDAIASETLGVGKTGHGTDALKWWKEGRMMEIAEYCCYDVKATKLVHEFGASRGQVYYMNDRTKRREAIAVGGWKIE